MTHSLPSTELSTLVTCYRRLCFRRWYILHAGIRFWADDEIPWHCRHYTLLDATAASKWANE